MPLGDRRCELCRNWNFSAPGEAGRDLGECRKNPPLTLTLNGRGLGGETKIQTVRYWPPAHSDDWCGAWERDPGGSPADRI